MQIDKTDAALKIAVVLSAIGVTVAAPYLGLFIVPLLNPVLKEVVKAGVGTISNVGANALWDLRKSFTASHENEDLTRLLGRAYSASIAEILEQAENNNAFGNFDEFIKLILPSIKAELDKHLATGREIDLLKLFPTEETRSLIELDGQRKLPFYQRIIGKREIEYNGVDDDLLANITAEEFILKLSNDHEAAKTLIAEEVEITLRRWFVQLNPKLANEYSFPPSLDKLVFEKIGELIPSKINRLVKQEDLDFSWKAFQRSHLQAILRQVNNLGNGLSENDRALLRPLGAALDKLSENHELITRLADGTIEILGRVGESEASIKRCIVRESEKLQKWLNPQLDKLLMVGTETLSTTRRTEAKLDDLTAVVSHIVSPFPGEISPNFVALPAFDNEIYGRVREIAAIVEFLKNEKEHLIIAAMTCLGKTSLITKFLVENLNEERNESLLPEVFTKVIYLECRKHQTFAGIAKHFATLLQTPLEFETGKEEDFLKHRIFPEIRNEKILLVLDNFEEWQTNGCYKNREIAIFVNTVLHAQSALRLVFLSWHLPHNEFEFTAKVTELDFVKEELEKGLEHDEAVKLVRGEGKKYCRTGSLVNLDTVDEKDLRQFFEDVHYIPQAIQSMVHFIGRKRISFSQFTGEYREIYYTEEHDATSLEEKRGNLLRPTYAMINLQISQLGETAKNLLRHAAFYGIEVPEDILTSEESDTNRKSEVLRDELVRISNSRLIIPAVNADDKEPFVLYHLHPFVLEAVRKNLPCFAETHEKYLENIVDKLNYKTGEAWKNKLFYRMLAIVECWERLDDHFIKKLNKTSRQFSRDTADFRKALASQEIANAFAVNLTADLRNYLQTKSEKLYLDYLEKYPDNADAYNNLGILIAKDESRWADSEAAFRKALELNSADAVAHYNLGYLLAQDESRRAAEAEAAFRKAIELNPVYAVAYNSLGLLIAKDKRRQAEAEAAFRKAIELNRNYAHAYYNLASLRLSLPEQETPDEAFEFLKKAVECDPKLKEPAKNNIVFDFLRDDPRFKGIIED